MPQTYKALCPSFGRMGTIKKKLFMSIIMTSQLMTILSWLSKSYVLMLILASVLIAVLFWGLFYQKRKKNKLNEEMAHILQLCSHNIEYELVLKAMKLST